jgi:glycosyltransferase involved in cell wall biosynthesis
MLAVPDEFDPCRSLGLQDGAAEVRDGTWVVMPVFDEAGVVGGVVRGVRAIFPNVVVVDDGSSDDSAARAAAAGAMVVRHLVNRGQGAALQTGTEFALSRGARRIAHFDADGQHDPADLLRLAAAVAAGECEIALGDRFAVSASSVPPSRRVLVRLAVLFHRAVSGARLHDVHNGLRVLSRRAAESIEITADRMAHASELVDLIVRSGLAYREIPVTLRYTDYSRAKGQRWSASGEVLLHYLMGRIFR